jgi:hypothetical protein
LSLQPFGSFRFSLRDAIATFRGTSKKRDLS